jgi:glucose-1-phosphate cytidylyltransferase
MTRGTSLKAVILAGGLGTRLAEETNLRPKPMVEIGGKPILWHIMNIYAANGVTDFIVCLGYKGYVIKEYFANYYLHSSSVTFDLSKNSIEVHKNTAENWRVTLVDTGESTMTGGRLKRVKDFLNNEESFCFTYGDGVGNVDVRKSIEFHRAHGRHATLTATQPGGRYGALTIKGDAVESFLEKPQGDGRWVNGGFFVLSPKVFDYIEGDSTMWEKEPLERLAEEDQLRAFRHSGFWQPMDTMFEKNNLEKLWNSGNAPWKVW